MFFYEPLSATAIVSVLLYLVFLIGMNELSRLNKWVGAAIFIALPLALTIFVWPHTAVEGTGAGTWFQWVKTYSCLAGAILGWLIVYFPAFQKKYIVCIPPIIFVSAVPVLPATCTFWIFAPAPVPLFTTPSIISVMVFAEELDMTLPRLFGVALKERSPWAL